MSMSHCKTASLIIALLVSRQLGMTGCILVGANQGASATSVLYSGVRSSQVPRHGSNWRVRTPRFSGHRRPRALRPDLRHPHSWISSRRRLIRSRDDAEKKLSTGSRVHKRALMSISGAGLGKLGMIRMKFEASLKLPNSSRKTPWNRTLSNTDRSALPESAWAPEQLGPK